MKIKCCGFNPNDKSYLKAVIQELVYFDPNAESLRKCEALERQADKWIREWYKVQLKIEGR